MADTFAFPFYADASAPNDNGAGTELSPKKFYPSMLPFLNYRQGQALLLRPGRFYDVATVGLGMSGIYRSHVTLKPWDNGESGNPCLDGRNWIAPNTQTFTYEGPAGGGGHVWSLIRGTENPVMRVFAASQNNGVLLSQRTMGEGIGTTSDAVADDYAQIAAALNEQDCWHGAGAALNFKLYMWTPSMLIDPSAYYQGLSFYQHGAGTLGFDNGILISSNTTNHAQDVRVSDIDIIGATGSNIAITANDNSNRAVTSILIERCNGYGVFGSGVRTRQAVSAAGISSGIILVSDVTARGCTMNTNMSSKEEERSRIYGHYTGADMYAIYDRVDNVVYEDCVAINARHSALALGTYSANSTLTTRSGFRRMRVMATAQNSYSRGFGISRCEDSCFVDQCTFDGMNARSQPAGSVLISNNSFINARKSIRLPASDMTDGHLAIESTVFDRGTANVGNERYIYGYPTNVRLYNNSFGPCPSELSPPISMTAYNGLPAGAIAAGLPRAPFDSNTVDFKNNLFMDNSQANKGKPFLIAKQETGVTIGDQVVDNNAVYKGEGEVATVTYRGVTTALNSAPGFTSNLTLNPKVDANLRPLRGSPLVAAGKVLGRAMRDTTGRERPPRVTIGAFEDFSAYTRQAR